MAKLNFNLSRKKLLLLGFLFVLLLAIPLTVYLVQQQLETRSQAVKNTTLSFNPSTATAQAGEDLTFDINLSPGSNQVNLVKLVISFDSTKLSATEESFTVDPASQLSVLEGPIVGADKLSVVLSVGSDPTKVIQTETKIGSVTFDVIGETVSTTEISFDPTTEISSTDDIDAFSENVFLSGVPALISIDGPTASPSPSITQTPTATSSPSQASGNSAPVCESLGLDVSATGVAPYTITFDASGNDSDGTIEKVTFTFEPNTTQEVATGSGISTDSVDVSATHTYETTGNYTASAVLTDDGGATSTTTVSCSANITITDINGNIDTASTTDDSDTDSTGGGTDTDDSDGTTGEEVTPDPIPATGPEETIVGFGILGGILLLIGTLLFLAL